MMVSFVFGKECGPDFLSGPGLTGYGRLLHAGIGAADGPALNVYLLRRLRLRAGALERARFRPNCTTAPCMRCGKCGWMCCGASPRPAPDRAGNWAESGTVARGVLGSGN
jgi:hypothetical protein